MCLDCGCGKPNDDHGDSRHILMTDIEAAAKASEISVEEAMKNINDGVKQGQSAQSSAD